MTFLKSIPPIAVVQAVARNGAQHQNHSSQNMRHAFAVRGQDLPEDESDKGSEKDYEKAAELNIDAVKALLMEVEQKHNQLKFELNESLNRILVSVIDRETGELIRQIPGEEAVAIAEHLKAVDFGEESGELKAGTFISSKI